MPKLTCKVAEPCESEIKKQTFETVGDRYKRCAFLNEIQHIDIYGKLQRSYVENRQKILSKNDAGFSVTSVSISPAKLNECGRLGCVSSKALDTENKLSSFRVATRKSNLYPGQDNLSKKARKRWMTCMKPTINANYQAAPMVPRF